MQGYTLRQCRGFMAAIERRKKQENLGLAIAFRMAQQDGKAFKQYLKDLDQ